MKILCGKCKKEMADRGTYIICESGLCDTATSTHAIPVSLSTLYKYQLTGTIIIIE